MVFSIIAFSVTVSLKSAGNGMSMGTGHTPSVRTP
jgi:hypothetical protein